LEIILGINRKNKMSGILYIVATPIGNLEDITLRALRVLKEVDLIAAEDTRQTKKLLTHFAISTSLTSYFQGNERGKLETLVSALEEGKNIALVSDAGTPGISDPGYPLIREAVFRGIKVEVIPGPCAAISALVGSGLPTDRFSFIGFLPDKPGKRKKVLEELKSFEHTLIFYVSKWKIEKTLQDCCEVFGNKPAVLARELTKLHEESLRASLEELAEICSQRELKGELVLLIGNA